jgi:hypothetical protein
MLNMITVKFKIKMLKTSDYFIIGAALISMILSIYLWFMVDKEAGLFVGIWVPSILGFGAYFKILKYRSQL